MERRLTDSLLIALIWLCVALLVVVCGLRLAFGRAESEDGDPLGW